MASNKIGLSPKWIYGKQQILAVLESNPKSILKIYCTPRSHEIITLLKNKHIFYKLRPADELTNIVGFEKHQNVIALIYEKKIWNLSKFLEVNSQKERLLIVILEQIQDVHNFGSIIRSCEIFGADGIIFGKHKQAPLSPAVYKTSSGAVSFLPLILVDNVLDAITTLKKRGFNIAATGFGAKTTPLKKIIFNKKQCIILGNEGQGVSSAVAKASDQIIEIEMLGKTKSLNVSVAAGIILYAATKTSID